jgi:parallel beta-helix repeat protein
MSRQRIAIALCLFSCVLAFVPAAHAKTLLVCPSCVYTTIQSAVNAANPGDIVSAQAGTYYENVIVSTPNITLKGQKPIGSVLLDCPSNGNGVGIAILSTGVTVKGFEVEDCLIGIEATLNPEGVVILAERLVPGKTRLPNSAKPKVTAEDDQNALITDNTFEENLLGVFLVETADCVVTGNDFFSNDEAIVTDYTFTDVIAGNTVEGISDDDAGIGINYGNQESVKGNNVRYSGYAGIYLYGTVGSSVSGNRTTRNAVGLWAETGSAGNTFSKNTSDANQYWDCEDDTLGSGTAGTADKWTSNHGDTSQPPGLCKH